LNLTLDPHNAPVVHVARTLFTDSIQLGATAVKGGCTSKVFSLASYKHYTKQWICGCTPLNTQENATPAQNKEHKNHTHSKHTLNILQFNINGISNKTPELQDFLRTHKIGTVLIQEIKLTKKSNSPLFSLFTKQSDNKGGGGFITLIHHNIPFTYTTA